MQTSTEIANAIIAIEAEIDALIQRKDKLYKDWVEAAKKEDKVTCNGFHQWYKSDKVKEMTIGSETTIYHGSILAVITTELQHKK